MAKAYAPEDEARVAGAREDFSRRAKARAAPPEVAGAEARRAAMLNRLAVADDVAGALSLADDPDDRKAVALAAKPLDDLSLDELAALRTFCLKAAKSPEADVAAGMVGRVLAAARPGAEPTEDAFEPTGAVGHGLLGAYLAHEAGRGRWAELLPLIDVPPLGRQGNAIPNQAWNRAWNGLKGGHNPPPLFLPVQPDGAYQLRLTIIPCNLDSVCVRVPVGDRHVPVTLHSSGEIDIEATADKDGWASGKWEEGNIRYGHEFVADITVRPQADGTVIVRAAIDGLMLAEWKGKAADIRPLDADTAPKGGPSVVVAGNIVLVRSAALRMLDGKAKVVPVKEPEAVPEDPEEGSDPPP